MGIAQLVVRANHSLELHLTRYLYSISCVFVKFERIVCLLESSVTQNRIDQLSKYMNRISIQQKQLEKRAVKENERSGRKI